jgi:methylase of polypeptide subunit release factors
VSSSDLARLRDAFLAADYTADGVADLLGPDASAALARNETVPARRACAQRPGDPLADLVRLFLLQQPIPVDAAEKALPLAEAFALGLVAASGAEVRALLDVRPHDEDFYIVADLGTGLDANVRPVPPEHVLGVGGASVSLAELTIRHPVASALDVGTGCGVQALHLSRHADRVVATDLLPRALRLAALSAGLSQVILDLREGPGFDPVADERFDLIVANPPFAIGGSGSSHRVYRDGGMAEDGLCRRLVGAAPDRLNPGGRCQLLANWAHRRGRDWREQVAEWLPAGVDAWVLQREILDPAAYVSLWLHDCGDVAAPDYTERYDAWLDRLAEAAIEAVGFGWIVLRRTDVADPTVRIEDWPNPVDRPLGPHVAETLDRWAWLQWHRADADLLAARLHVPAGVVQGHVGPPGFEDPEKVTLHQTTGLHRERQVDTATAALVGASDGDVPVGVLIDAVAEVLGEPAADLRARLLPIVRELVADGFLTD